MYEIEMEAPLTPEQLATRWSVHKETIRKWVREGRLRKVGIGRRVRIPMSEVLRVEQETESVAN